MRCKVCAEIILRNPTVHPYRLLERGLEDDGVILHNGNSYCLQHYKSTILNNQ